MRWDSSAWELPFDREDISQAFVSIEVATCSSNEDQVAPFTGQRLQAVLAGFNPHL
jgi:hypothetical protein